MTAPNTPLTRSNDSLADLVEVMRRLRAPEGGCPWDLEQTFETIAPYTIEEAYEVADAIERGDLSDLREELGDLLLQVVFHSQMAKEQGAFDIKDVARSIVDKMEQRHPHVFGDVDVADADAQTFAWETMKAAERARKANGRAPSALDGVALALPALMRAEKLQKRAARTGFDWPTPTEIFDKLDEETAELKDAIASGDTRHMAEEVGDLLFVAANLARKLKIDPEEALRAANSKFERRFRAMERAAETNAQTFSELDLDAQEALWTQVKQDERA
ncbi:MAG: nucleoside triphosphate pyrophosphohydrolase [Pseudomonadota bacterium]